MRPIGNFTSQIFTNIYLNDFDQGLEGDTVEILLCGGDKGSQAGDIETAKAFWKDYQRSKAYENS